ncbi:MAG: phospho-sugar mutase [Woeseiaceae bacterium]|nr:phospho-sugar mutase [Woeseiaceae bacterium]
MFFDMDGTLIDWIGFLAVLAAGWVSDRVFSGPPDSTENSSPPQHRCPCLGIIGLMSRKPDRQSRATGDEGLAMTLQAWLTRDPDPATRDELCALRDSENVDELRARFAGRLQFGTAGLRGIVGAGPMRMNRLVVRETSAGLARYLAATLPDAADRGVVIAYDARPDSRRFAEDAASVFTGAGLCVYLTRDVQPTPLAAFGVLHYNAAAGVVVTASHNPPEYNGYKVYWANGAQIIPPHDAGIAASIDEAARNDIPWLSLEEAGESGLLQHAGDELVDAYCRKVFDGCPPARSTASPRIGVTYTALHGVGAALAERLMREDGLCDFASVATQHEPDGRFPTVAFPNPEEPGAMDAVIELARERNATLACANDPDADRLAVAARNDAGDYEMLTGDQVGVLLGSWMLERPHDFTPIVCASMVSSRMLGTIAEAAGAQYFETLSGFKWLANVALQHEDDDHRFLYAYEEALGYALGQVVCDKDGLSALLAFTRMASELASEGRTVLNRLEALYRRHGLYLSAQRSIATHPGAPSITGGLRGRAPTEIAGFAISSVKDLEAGSHVYADGRRETLDVPPGDVLIYYLEEGSRIIVRPSGTEPKTKCYYEVIEQVAEGVGYENARNTASRKLQDLVTQHQASIADLATA